MKKRNISLIEILVVVAIIGILASLLLPSLGKARAKARQATCVSNLKQTALTIYLYADDNDDTMMDMMLNPGNQNGYNGFDLWSWAYMNSPNEMPYCPNTLEFVDNTPSSFAVDSISPLSVSAGTGGAMGDVQSIKSYFGNNWRFADSPTNYTQLARSKAGLFKATYPLKLNEVENDTIAIYENYRRGSGGADAVDYLEQFGIKGFAFNMVSTGYHENRGLNAAVIDGSVSFIKTNSLIGSSEYQLSTGGSWETNQIGHLIHNGLNNIVPTGTKWNWNDN
jgi:type II secretory pathway pseudopilin PulG